MSIEGTGAQDPKAGRRYLRKAKKLQDEGKRTEALAVLRLGLEVSPNDAELQYTLGHALRFGLGCHEDCIEAAEWWRKAAAQGHIESQNQIGTLCIAGYGIPFDPAEALYWFKQAASTGDGWAYGAIASMYFKGEGVKKDYAESLFWWSVGPLFQGDPGDVKHFLHMAGCAAKFLAPDEIAVVADRVSRWIVEHPSKR